MRKLLVITFFFTFLQVSGQFEPVPADGIWYRDLDGDGYGNPKFPRQSTTKPPGYAPNGLDCDDNDASVWREGLWYADVDGFGDPGVSQVSCHPPPG